jgi:hypothetical protein
MWNVSKPNTGDGEDEQEGYGNGPQSGGFHGSRTSLLGPPPGPSGGARFPSLPNAPRPLNRIPPPTREIERQYGQHREKDQSSNFQQSM